jgi:hypothetical protein
MKKRNLEYMLPKSKLLEMIRNHRGTLDDNTPEDVEVISVKDAPELDSILILCKSIEFPLQDEGELTLRKLI